MRSRNLLRMRALRTGGVALHAGNAAIAALTAASTSAALANGTVRITWPVEGLVTSPARLLVDVAARPLIHSGTRVPAGVDSVELDMDSSMPRVLYSRNEIG